VPDEGSCSYTGLLVNHDFLLVKPACSNHGAST
jgi:hypothetical protein